MNPLRASLLCCVRIFSLLLALVSAKALFASTADVDRHLRANAILLETHTRSAQKRFDEAFAVLSGLSESSLTRLLTNEDSLSASEKLNALLIKESAQLLAERHGIELDFKGAASEHLLQLLRDGPKPGTKRGEHSRLLNLVTESVIDDSDRAAIIRRFDATIDAEIRAIDEKIPALFESDAFRIANPMHEAFLKRLSTEYFKRLPLSEKRLLLLDVLSNNPSAKTPDIGFEVLFKHAGPQYQKLLQIVAREEGLDPELAKVLKKLESSVPEAPFNEIEAELKARIPEVYPSRVRIVSEKPLGSGTLAQTYSALMKTGDSEMPVALRLLRPGIAQKIAEEKEIFEEITPLIENDPLLRGTPFSKFGMIWTRIAENVDEELHVEITVQNQKNFQQLFNEQAHLKIANKGLTNDIRVPKVYMTELAGKGVMIQEFVNGKSFEKMGLADPLAARKAAQDFAMMWMREAMFLSGYHHSDPHQGNLRVADADSLRPQVYLLDYGMVGRLSEAQRSDLILMGYALRIKDASKAAFHASELLARKATSSDIELIERMAASEMLSAEASAPGLLEKLVVAGLEFPRELVSFNRGYFMVNQLLRQTGSEETLSTLTARMGQALIGQDVMKRVVGWRTLPKGAVKPTPLTDAQLWRITGREIKNSCAKAMLSLLAS